jgi:hypothetical protein
MPLRYLVVSVTLIAVATPAFAAEYYVAKNAETGKCAVVSEKPDGTKLVMVGTQAYATEKEAKTAKKASAECPKKKEQGAAAKDAPASNGSADTPPPQ